MDTKELKSYARGFAEGRELSEDARTLLAAIESLAEPPPVVIYRYLLPAEARQSGRQSGEEPWKITWGSCTGDSIPSPIVDFSTNTLDGFTGVALQ